MKGMRRNNTTMLLVAVMLISAWLLTACDMDTVYHKYAHTPINGWEKRDTLFFDVPPIKHGDHFSENLGLRINGTFPFMSLRLIVAQEVIPGNRIIRDTINCSLVDRKGNVKGQGISYYQYNFRVNDVALREGDSLHVCIRHDMKREILPGVADIGMKITRRR